MTKAGRRHSVFVYCGLLAWLVLNIASATQCILDHDLFHQMAFAREMLRRHAVPMADSFAYTPTVPVVHYEWGAGLIDYAVLSVGGWDGVMVWTLMIAAAALGMAVWMSRRLGAHPGIIALVGLVFVPLMARGYPPVRAQAYSYLFFLSLIAAIEFDKSGDKRPLRFWPLVFVAWMNVHPSAVLAFGILGLYWITRPRRMDLAALLGVLCAATFLTPFGTALHPRLVRALLLPRPGVGEWQAIWTPAIAANAGLEMAVGLLLLVYVFRQRAVDRYAGILLAVCFVAACLHVKMLPYFAFTVVVYGAAALTRAEAGKVLIGLLDDYRVLMRCAWVAMIIACSVGAVGRRCWNMRIPETPSGTGAAYYPVRAVDYLLGSGFHGNLMTDFHTGAYVTWRMYPAVRVSFDARWDAAYPDEVFEQHIRAYWKGEWRQLESNTDAILVPRGEPLEKALDSSDWRKTYQDEGFAVYARPRPR